MCSPMGLLQYYIFILYYILCVCVCVLHYRRGVQGSKSATGHSRWRCCRAQDPRVGRYPSYVHIPVRMPVGAAPYVRSCLSQLKASTQG